MRHVRGVDHQGNLKGVGRLRPIVTSAVPMSPVGFFIGKLVFGDLVFVSRGLLLVVEGGIGGWMEGGKETYEDL